MPPLSEAQRADMARTIRATPIEAMAGVGMQADNYHEQMREFFALIVEGRTAEEAEQIVREARR